MKTWYAIYTKPRNEKKACSELVKKGIEVYLPLLETLKQWSDRKKKVEEPLFKSYLFVHISKDDYYEVLNTPGIVRYITFEGKAVPIPDIQIRAIEYFLDSNSEPDAEEITIKPGEPVEIIKGSLTGLVGTLVERSGKHKVRIEIDALGQSILLSISKSQIRATGV